jgi:WD40 repeat protein
VWDVAAGAELFDLRPTGRAGALAVSPDGEWIVTGGPNSQTRIWPARQGAEPVVLSGHMKEVTAAAVSPDSTLAATGDDRGLICLWKLSDGKWQPSHVMKGHSRTITALRFADGDLLVSASGDNTCGQWNVATGQELRQRVLRHPEWVSSLDVTPDGRHAITSCDDGRARVWRLADAQEVAVQESPGGVFTCVNFSPDGQAGLLTSSADRQVRSWDWTAAGSEPEIVIDWRQRGGQLWAARFAGRTDHVLTIGGNDAQLWDLNAAEPIVRFSPHGVVSSAALSSNGRLAATASWDNSIKLWDAATGKAVRKLEDAHGGYVNSVAFSPVDNAQLLSASDDGTAILWSLREGAGKLRTLAGHKGRVHQAVYSADGARVLTVGSDKTARLWDARTGKELQVFKGHEWAVLCGALSNDGARVLTGSQDNTAIVWDAATGRPLQTLSGHTASVTSVAFSEEGARALTGSQDRAAKLWDAETGKEILTLGGHTREVTSVAFSPDGRNVLTASRDGSAILWLAEPWNAPPVAAAK